ncbi:alanyl-tRNA synthetase [Lapidilactobacillus dextrinicus DSM 20335]|uniref:Alanine--tRNA ligase n=1 Tax=Lapidilactobacillus dextrinicus DSM 20335 TaxID=1423738 RepID=A0A0R2BHF6_9LACO|nr:alanine--tRNA ligase [Lapidilactobacillus dextrinicus]KRM78448.1 alanyl-tRNA synthetase [Lapidilactobacillus dextrinicus DSM 20335]QFG47247.1 alanine--tRNA ligase [Lapidilactobacillus dextrinicus]
MKKLSSAEFRQMFLDFFKSKGHDVEPSASLVPKDDPTLLWINSGVATLKKYFDGTVVPKNPRITNAQKSIRTNDIENVGKTARHHTFFEMLGNFSVGDYFKEDAIPWAWELLTSPKWLAMDPERLFVTVYPKDTEAYRIWHEVVGLPEDHIIKVEDNFWDIGEGPSGPDSEIFYDRGQEFNNVADDDPENYPGGENERYLEIWNIVFSEFNHLPDGSFVEQPHKNIDTGMGLERVVSIIQDAPTNFETDLFMPLIHKTEAMSGQFKYGQDPKTDIAFKIIADHARAVSFAIGDGAMPSNEGRGYVLRRLIRRAVLNGRRLGINQSFLYQLVPVVGKIMESYYPEVRDQQAFIAKVIKSEEERFSETLTDGLALLNDLIAKQKAAGQTVIGGRDAFKLFDTYGFPIELTVEYAADEGLTVNEGEFDEAMAEQKNRARAARGNRQSMGSQDETLLNIKVDSQFDGYQHLAIDDAKLVAAVANDQEIQTVASGTAGLIFDRTPFYAEMGGQVADQGVILNRAGEQVAVVKDVQHAPNGQNIHTVEASQPLTVGETYQLRVDETFRKKVRRNHTATHLLDQALRDVLGEHTHQAGSLVEPNYLRFDFNNIGQVTREQLDQVEKIVNEKIWAEIPVTTTEMPLADAKKLGAIALFSEKYGDRVRVVQVGDYSMELCGGTHVQNTAEIGLFKITSESGTAAGIRRIEAVTAQEAFEYLNNEDKMLHDLATDLKVTQLKELPNKAEHLQQELKDAQRDLQNLKAKMAQAQANDALQTETVGQWQLTSAVVPNVTMNELRQLADNWRDKPTGDILILGTAQNDKANLLVATTPDAVKRGAKAGDLIKNIAPVIGGGGGGRPDMAQAGGKKPDQLPAALQAAKTYLTK